MYFVDWLLKIVKKPVRKKLTTMMMAMVTHKSGSLICNAYLHSNMCTDKCHVTERVRMSVMIGDGGWID